MNVGCVVSARIDIYTCIYK